jgi:hypothetical protein
LAPTGTGTITANVLSSATYANAVTLSNAGNSFTGSGAGLTSLNASNLSTGTIPGTRIAPTRTSAVNAINTASNGTTVSATVACPSGVLLGGGGQAASTSGIPVALVESYPSSATQWTATAVDNGNGNNKNLSVTAWVVCGGS